MKRSEMLLKLQRLYSVRHCMVELDYITKDQFMEEVLYLVEHYGMRPPLWDNFHPTREERLGSSDADWNPHYDESTGKVTLYLECDWWENE